MGKPALTLEPAFKSTLEKKVATQLTAAGIEFGYETRTVRFTVPSREARYNPDFDILRSGNIILEAKGRFGHRGSDSVGAKVRQHLALAKEQNPNLDIRIVFQDATKPIYKRSPTTYAKWAEDHGFKWADKGIVPASWIKEMRNQQHDGDGNDTPNSRPRSASNASGKDRSRPSRKG